MRTTKEQREVLRQRSNELGRQAEVLRYKGLVLGEYGHHLGSDGTLTPKEFIDDRWSHLHKELRDEIVADIIVL